MNYPSEWIREYIEGHHYRYDPTLHMLNRVFEEDTPIVYGSVCDCKEDILAKTSDPETREKILQITGKGEEHGLVTGIYLYYRHGTKLNLMSLNSRDPNLVITEEDIARMMNAIIRANHIISLSTNCSECHPRINTEKFEKKKLTSAEIKLLKFFYTNIDSSAKKAAASLGVSEHTVHQHLKNIRAKLKKDNASGHALAQMAHSLALI